MSQSRSITLTSDRFIKRQSPRSARTEYALTMAGAEIGRRSGLFYVPKIAAHDLDNGVIESERIDGMVSLYDWLKQNPDEMRWSNLAGRALGRIHRELQLPETQKTLLPADWNSATPTPMAFLHGDYNVWNVLIDVPNDRLVVCDWSMSDLCGGEANYGPAVFDTVWMIVSLFSYRYFGLERLPKPEEAAQAFVTAWANEYGHDELIDNASSYIMAQLHTFRRFNTPRGSRLFRPLKRIRKRYTAIDQLSDLARRFKSDIAESEVRRDAA